VGSLQNSHSAEEAGWTTVFYVGYNVTKQAVTVAGLAGRWAGL